MRPDLRGTVPAGPPLRLGTARAGQTPEQEPPSPPHPTPRAREGVRQTAQRKIPAQVHSTTQTHSRRRPGKGPPSSLSPAAARKHSAQRRRAPGAPPCRPVQRRRGRIRPVRPAQALPLQRHRRHLRRKRAAPPPKPISRKSRSVRPFHGWGRTTPAPAGRPRPAAGRPQRGAVGGLLRFIPHPKPPPPQPLEPLQLPIPAHRPPPSSRGRHPGPSGKTARRSSLRRPVWAFPARARTAVPRGQGHARLPLLHNLMSVARRHRPAQQERAEPLPLPSLPSVAGYHRLARQERAKLPSPASLLSAA